MCIFYKKFIVLYSNTLLGNTRILYYLGGIIMTSDYNEDDNQYEYWFFDDYLNGTIMIKNFITV